MCKNAPHGSVAPVSHVKHGSDAFFAAQWAKNGFFQEDVAGKRHELMWMTVLAFVGYWVYVNLVDDFEESMVKKNTFRKSVHKQNLNLSTYAGSETEEFK